jgi:hypothetical protein
MHPYISDVDPKLPTAFEDNIQFFVEDDKQVVRVGNIDQVEYFKCKQCDSLIFFLYTEYKRHFAVVHLKIEDDTLGKFWQ